MDLKNVKRIFSGMIAGVLFISFPFQAMGKNIRSETDIHAMNADEAMMLYSEISNEYIREYDFKQAVLYLDSAFAYNDKVTDPEVLGYYYNTQGYYYSLKMIESKEHENYYKAIHYYEKAGKEHLTIPIYHNLAFSYIQKKDTRNLRKIIDKMLPLSLTQKNNNLLISTYNILAFYYECLYEKHIKQTALLDSAIFYNKQIIEISKETKNTDTMEIAYNYVHLASNLLKKKDFNPDSLTSYIKKAEESSDPLDTAMTINCDWVKGEIAFNTGKLTDAKNIFTQQLLLMDQWQPEENLNMYADVYDRLSNISEMQKDYNNALLYERKKTNCLNIIHDAEKYEIISELQTRYEVNKKDMRISRLQEKNRFQEKINWLYAGICILCFIASYFIIRWLRSKKKVTESQLHLTRMEKQEAILQSQLKVELLKKVELEKYEALLENHFKNLQLSGMDDALEDLKKEQVVLNEQIKQYADKVHEYEKNRQLQTAKSTITPYYSSIIRDLCELIKKRLQNTPAQKDYIEKLQHVSESFFERLKNAYQEDLSVTNIKYCICFTIGMDTRHIADCFSVEIRSIHMARHRLKANFNMNKEMDFDLFLRQMLDEI